MTFAPEPVWVLGAGGHAIAVADALLAANTPLAGFVVDTLPTTPLPAGDLRTRYPVLLWDDRPAHGAFALGVGTNRLRQAFAQRLKADSPSTRLVTVVHPQASVSALANLAEGAVVLALARVAAQARVAQGALVNTAAIVEHDCVLDAYASLAPAAVLGGACRVGEAAALGLGAHVRHGLSIGADCVVGASSYVHHDLPARVVAWGIPARVQRSRDPQEPYL